jgi:DNA polymerase-1
LRIVIDTETNSLVKPTKLWVVACRDIDTNELYIFRNLTDDDNERRRFIDFANAISYLIGHNLLGYDLPVLEDLVGYKIDVERCMDTLVISKLADYPRKGHSIADYGIEFGYEKIKHYDFSKYSDELETYCVRDVDICSRIYAKYHRFISNPDNAECIDLEHRFQLVANSLHTSGFGFNTKKAEGLLERVTKELRELDEQILSAFPPRLKLIREITPKETKHGTISLTSIPKSLREDIPDFTVGAPFSYCSWSVFNPSSHTQIIRVLNEAGWRPIEKTETHKDVEREYNKLRYRHRDEALDISFKELYTRLQELRITGWKITEANLETLPSTAPAAARLLAKRILLESRRRTLTEWLDLVSSDGRIHGKFYALGAWTHRMAHQNPNTANIPNAVRVSDGKPSLYGKELRSLWQAPKNRLLVGVDAEAIQLRVFAHLINDPTLTYAIVNGKKSEGTDPHSLNKTYFGEYCKTRNAAKHSLYAMFFGGGPSKIAEIMGCTVDEAKEAIDALVEKYPGLAELHEDVIPRDAHRGYLTGLDGRKVRIPGDTVGARKHLWMSGALQNGEKVVMAKATIKFEPELALHNSFLVNLVHDEWQTETPNNMEIAIKVAQLQCDALVWAGEELNLNCPMAGSYWNDDDNDYTIATNWSKTH